MIRSIRLKNFQKWKDLLVKLGPGVNTIVGPTDAGKSSVLRAARFAALNHLAGRADSYTTHGAAGTAVKLVTDDHKVVRQRGAGGNAYLLDGKRYVSFGQSVPEGVTRALKLYPVNFQGQLDPPFWFTDTPGQVSRNLNQIVNLEVIDSTLAGVAAELSRARNEVKFCEGRLADAGRERDGLRWAVAAGEKLATLEAVSAEWQETASSFAQLQKLVRGGVSLTRTLVRLTDATRKAKNAQRRAERWRKLLARREALRQLVGEIKQARRVLAAPAVDVGPLVKMRAAADRFADRRRDLESSVTRAKQLEKELCQIREEQSETATRLKRLCRSGVCPACGQPLAKSSAALSATCTSHQPRPHSGLKSLTGTRPRPVT